MISFRAFTKRFGAHTAVDGVSLTLTGGEVVALLGPNGSGKTTCLKAAAGLLSPTSGEVLLNGRPARSASARAAISYLPQKVAFPDGLTGREVVQFYAALRGRAGAAPVEEALHFASLNGASGKPVATYSGGMTQRLGLAVAMLAASDALLLDEPTAALDPDGLRAFYGLVERRREEGRAVLFTSHQLGDVERLASRFAVLVGGRLVASLTAAELRERLASRGVLRLRLDRAHDRALTLVQRIAPGAGWFDGELVVSAAAEVRPAVLDAVRESGAQIQGLVAEEGRLDDLYRELVEAPACV